MAREPVSGDKQHQARAKRDARLAEALRNNLKRRKAQERARGAAAIAPAGKSGEPLPPEEA